MTTKTISFGAFGRDYPSITLWQAALPTSGSGTWDGVLYNDAEFFNESPGAGALDVGGSTNWPETLAPAVGQSAFDNSANPLKYDVSKGVGIRTTNNYSQALRILSGITISRVQVCQQGGGNNNSALNIPFGSTPVRIDRCLFQQDSSTSTNAALMLGTNGGGTQVMTNSVIIANQTGTRALVLAYGAGTTVANVTMVKPSNVSTAGAEAITTSGSPKIINCAMFGFASAVNVIGGTPTGSNNATDAASIGFTSASSLTSQTYANQFTGITTTGGLDFRLKSGNSLDGAGATDTTDIPAGIDIFGTTR